MYAPATTVVDRLPPFTLRQIEVFLTVVYAGGFSSAAERLVLSEPAVVAQIKELEGVFGCRLLDRKRGRRGVSLTPAGEPLFAACETAFAVLREGSAAVRSRQPAERAGVSLGVTPGFSGEVLPWLYTDVQSRHADVDLTVTIDRRASIQEGLISGSLDLGVFSDATDDERLVSAPLSTYELLLVGPTGHRFAAESTVPFRELASEQLVCRHAQSAPMEAMMRLAAERGVKLRVAREIDDMDMLIQAVAQGLGITALTHARLAVGRRVAEGRLAVLNVEGFPIRCDWRLAQARRPGRPEVEALRAYLIDAYREPPRQCPYNSAGEMSH
jgi:LysR family transcriptional regulator, low CO2-responsive transcriptional regulator